MSSAKRTTRTDLSASLALPTSGCAKPDVPATELSSSCKVEGKFYPGKARRHNMRVPVLDAEMRPLMPTIAVRARLLLSRGQASAYRNKLGIFCIILHKKVEPNNQPLALGIDPGSSFEGWSVVGSKNTVLNGTSQTPKHVKDAIEQRRIMRKNRRNRNCRRRQCRSNRNVNRTILPPSTFARWNAKLRILNQLKKIVPISLIAIEDVAAHTKEGKNLKWNAAFSPLETGKQWFYTQIRETGIEPVLYKGTDTKKFRDFYRLNKTKQKDRKSFSAHSVDAWALAAVQVGAQRPTDTRLYYWTPIRLHRRQLHAFHPAKGGIRKPYGGTRSLRFSRGTLVRDKKNRLQYIGGSSRGRISLHCVKTGKRTTQKAKSTEVKILSCIAFRTEFVGVCTSPPHLGGSPCCF